MTTSTRQRTPAQPGPGRTRVAAAAPKSTKPKSAEPKATQPESVQLESVQPTATPVAAFIVEPHKFLRAHVHPVRWLRSLLRTRVLRFLGRLLLRVLRLSWKILDAVISRAERFGRRRVDTTWTLPIALLIICGLAAGWVFAHGTAAAILLASEFVVLLVGVPLAVLAMRLRGYEYDE